MAAAHLALASSLSSAKAGYDDEEGSHLQAALALYKQLGDLENQARASKSLGEYFQKKKDSAKTRSYYETALQLSRLAKKADLEAGVLSDIGEAYRSSGDPLKALDFYHKAEKIYESIN